MKTTRVLMVIAVLCASMFVTENSFAKDATVNGVQLKRNARVVLVNRQQLLRLAQSLDLKVYTFKTLKRDSRKPKSPARNGCGCSLIQDDFDASGCFTRCLQSWGISYASAVACGGACIGASAGNPIAIAVCAGCLGTGEWIVMGCSLNCVWTRGFGGIMEAKARQPHNPIHRATKTPRAIAKV